MAQQVHNEPLAQLRDINVARPKGTYSAGRGGGKRGRIKRAATVSIPPFKPHDLHVVLASLRASGIKPLKVKMAKSPPTKVASPPKPNKLPAIKKAVKVKKTSTPTLKKIPDPNFKLPKGHFGLKPSPGLTRAEAALRAQVRKS
jgi:hypothetical protein